jgi:hypothetical protein
VDLSTRLLRSLAPVSLAAHVGGPAPGCQLLAVQVFTTAGRRARYASPELWLSAVAQGRAVGGVVANELRTLWDASLARRPLALTFGLEPAESEEGEAPAANGEEGPAPAAGDGAAATASAAQGECPPGSPAATASKRSRRLGRR